MLRGTQPGGRRGRLYSGVTSTGSNGGGSTAGGAIEHTCVWGEYTYRHYQCQSEFLWDAGQENAAKMGGFLSDPRDFNTIGTGSTSAIPPCSVTRNMQTVHRVKQLLCLHKHRGMYASALLRAWSTRIGEARTFLPGSGVARCSRLVFGSQRSPQIKLRVKSTSCQPRTYCR